VTERRAFIGTLVGGLLAGPFALEAQQAPSVRRIGYIYNVPATPLVDSWWQAFDTGLRDHGWVEHQNIVVERRSAELRREAALAAAEELVRLKVDVIVVASTMTALAAKHVTTVIPIIMTIPGDPVGVGLVESLARPGGNVTGLSFVGTELAGKQVELLRQTLPALTRLAVVSRPDNASHPARVEEVAAAAQTLKLQLHVVEVRTPRDVEDAFRTMAQQGTGAVIVLADALFAREASIIARLAVAQRLPTMFGFREHVLAGGLMSYGPSFADLFRRAAGYVDKILRGASPRDLPVEQASTFELVINLKTAKALGLTIPPSLLQRADQVIE
jgi:putative ABC transport system substrate-binding protein